MSSGALLALALKTFLSLSLICLIDVSKILAPVQQIICSADAASLFFPRFSGPQYL
jgi:hypothetical protein